MPVGRLYVLLGKMSVQVLCSFFNWVVCFSDAELYKFFAILHINALLDISFANIFFHSVGGLFVDSLPHYAKAF